MQLTPSRIRSAPANDQHLSPLDVHNKKIGGRYALAFAEVVQGRRLESQRLNHYDLGVLVAMCPKTEDDDDCSLFVM